MNQNWQKALVSLNRWWMETLPLRISGCFNYGSETQERSYEEVEKEIFLKSQDYVRLGQYVYQRATPQKLEIQTQVRRRNIVRWRRLHSDIRWLRSKLRKLGIDPDDWRLYLDV